VQTASLKEEGNNVVLIMKDQTTIKLPKPSKGKMYKPKEIWPLIADNVKKKHLRAVLILLIDGKKIPCQLRNAYS
jgi:hypothetical protein